MNRLKSMSIANFTITLEIHARSLVNFHHQYADRHMNLKNHATHQRARAGNLTKEINVSF